MNKVNISVSASSENKKTKSSASHSVSSSATHRTLQKSTTLSRRYVKRPIAKKINVTSPSDAPKKKNLNIIEVSADDARKQEKLALKKARQEKIAAEKAARAKKAAAEKAARAEKVAAEKAARAKKLATEKAAREKRLAERKAAVKKHITRPLLRQRAAKPVAKPIAKKVTKTTPSDKVLSSAIKASSSDADKKLNDIEQSLEMEKNFRKKNRGRRILLALVCSAVTVGALVAFVHFNMPDISVKVAAMQTGIEATYPSFIPRGYTLSNVSSEKNDTVIISFTNSSDASFTLTEEKSTWDSTALLNNYVKKNYPSDYATLREQGITIYVRGEKACWVNGGILFKISSSGGTLTKEQIKNIATSM